jgi:hypothetical protein
MTRNLPALANNALSTCTAERTSRASAVSSSLTRLPFNWSGVITSQPGSRNRFTAADDIFSATMIFMRNNSFQASVLKRLMIKCSKLLAAKEIVREIPFTNK